MIERNVGTPERVIRFLLSIALLAWIFTSARFGFGQGVALLAASALAWNSVFGRCYLWKWLGLSSCKEGDSCNRACAGNTTPRA